MQVEQVVNHKIFEKGETVISPFAVPQLAIVAHGSLKIYQLSSAGKEQLLRVIEPGGNANLLFATTRFQKFVVKISRAQFKIA